MYALKLSMERTFDKQAELLCMLDKRLREHDRGIVPLGVPHRKCWCDVE